MFSLGLSDWIRPTAEHHGPAVLSQKAIPDHVRPRLHGRLHNWGIRCGRHDPERPRGLTHQARRSPREIGALPAHVDALLKRAADEMAGIYYALRSGNRSWRAIRAKRPEEAELLIRSRRIAFF